MVEAVGPARLSEKLVAWIWQRQRLTGPLHCADGRTIQVVFPGRAWGEGRPDFQGALIAWESGELQRGDVEIHVRERDWRTHGHHRDPAYDGVLLHVVFRASRRTSTMGASGRAIPTIALEGSLARPLEQLAREFQEDQQPASPACQDDALAVTALLERAGQARFLAKAARFEADLSALAPSEVLWRGVARALGYSANASAMEQLAERVPLAAMRELQTLVMPGSGSHLTVLAALLGSAGLLPSQRPLLAVDRLGAMLEERWRWLNTYGWQPAVATEGWELARVRPANGPVRRLAGLACLAVQWHESDPARDLSQIVLRSADRAAPLINRFIVEAPNSGWASLHDLAGPLRPPALALVGRSRAVEIVANAVLPMVYALGRTWGLDDLSTAALRAYGHLPRGAESGLTKHMALQLVGAEYRRVVTSTLHQQGLLHLFRSSCEAHTCEICPGRPLDVRSPRHRSA